jgi:hypothetical protein
MTFNICILFVLKCSDFKEILSEDIVSYYLDILLEMNNL